MSPPLRSTLLVLVFSTFCNLKTTADKAIPLITVKKNSRHGQACTKFVLNADAISALEQLSSPLNVISAIGDARVGKSTVLNFVHRILSNSATHKKLEDEVFETGNTLKAVTRGVWISTINGKRGMDNVVLLDVEGTDLGDDSVTDKLSIFTALMSSSLTLFMKESPSTHITDFLYKIVRLSELAFGKKETEHFPHLTAVLRGVLEVPNGFNSISEYIKAFLIKPGWDDELDDKRKEIGTRFLEERITVFDLPYISPKDFKNFQKLSSSEYLDSIEALASHLKASPVKKTLNGAVLDGQTLADLAKKLVDVMNNEKLWEGLNPDFCSLFEENVCTKSYDELIKPLLDVTKMTLKDIKDQKDEKLELFKKRCILKERVLIAKYDINEAMRIREEYEKERNIWETVKDVVKWAGSTGLGIAIGHFLSDLKLKENVTLVDNCEYATIGLRGVKWVWNKEAERLGLNGRGSGVVAQDVELLYPWAVTEGHDGYKRVNYFALRLLILVKRIKPQACGRRQSQSIKIFQLNSGLNSGMEESL